MDNINPYVGPRPFEREDQPIFFGRDPEANDLLSLVIAHSEVLFYAQSGAGKTSLLNAKVTPQLEEEGFEVLPTARVRGLIPENAKLEDIPNLFVFNTLLSWVERDIDIKKLAKLSLADYLKERPRSTDPDELPRVIIFDQFEELFSFYLERWQDRKEFFKQVREALKQDPMLRVVFAMREDYIARLDPYSSLLPENLRMRYRMERMRKNAALKAVINPLKETDCSFAEGVAEQLVDDLLAAKIETEGESVSVAGEFVEPVQLQVVCEGLWLDLPKTVKEVTQKHLRTLGDVNQALSGFYQRAIDETLENNSIKEGDLRQWFEKSLITPAETRGTVYKGGKETGGIANEAVEVLENFHIIRGEWRAGASWYELTHDRFIEPILDSNRKWWAERGEAEQAHKRLKMKADEWVRMGRGKGGLLDEVELREARRTLKLLDSAELDYDNEITDLVKDSSAAIEKVKAEKEAARKRELEQAKALAKAEEQAKSSTRLRQLAILLFIAFIVALGATVYALRLKGLADDNADEAFKQKGIAERKANEADSLFSVTKRQKDLVDTLLVKQEEQTEIAKENADEALRQKGIAERKANEADSLRDAAETAKVAAALTSRAQRQRRIGDPKVAALLARHAYEFNKEGAFIDDVYDALRNTLNHVIFDSVGGPKVKKRPELDWVRSVAFSARGQIASGHGDGFIRIWDSDSSNSPSNELLGGKAPSSSVRAVAFNKSGARLVSASDDGQVILWNLDSQDAPSEEGRLSVSAGIWAVAFRPNSAQVAIGGADTKLGLWSLEKNKLETLFAARQSLRIRTLAFSHDGKYLAAGSDDGMLRIWVVPPNEKEDSKQKKTADSLFVEREAHRGGVNSVAFNVNGSLATGGVDADIKLWEISQKENKVLELKEKNVPGGHESRVNAVAFSPDGKLLASGSSDKSVRIWNLEHLDRDPIVLLDHQSWIWSIAFSADGKRLISGGADKTIRSWAASAKNLADKVEGELSDPDWKRYVGVPRKTPSKPIQSANKND